jgi:hypothetical protein
MTIGQSYVYACPVPDREAGPAFEPFPSSGVISVKPGLPVVPVPGVEGVLVAPGAVDVQGLLDTIAAQRQELEAMRVALVLIKAWLTPEQREALRRVADALEEEQP